MTNQTMVDEDHHVVALVDDVVSDDDPDNLERKVNEDTQPVEEAPTKRESQKEKGSSLQICSSRLRLLGLPKQTHSHSPALTKSPCVVPTRLPSDYVESTIQTPERCLCRVCHSRPKPRTRNSFLCRAAPWPTANSSNLKTREGAKDRPMSPLQQMRAREKPWN